MPTPAAPTLPAGPFKSATAAVVAGRRGELVRYTIHTHDGLTLSADSYLFDDMAPVTTPLVVNEYGHYTGMWVPGEDDLAVFDMWLTEADAVCQTAIHQWFTAMPALPVVSTDPAHTVIPGVTPAAVTR